MHNTPLIGITCRTHIVPPRGEGSNSATAFLGQKDLVECIIRAGGNPVLLPAVEPGKRAGGTYAQAIIDELDGVLVAGGDDGDPAQYGQEPHPKLGFVDDLKGRFEAVLVRQALDSGAPVFGICGGHQMLNVVCGGTLHQDVQACTGSTMQHAVAQTELRPCHSIDVVPGSRLHAALGKERLRVNSVHHQAVAEVGDGLAVTARAPDGTIEALERRGGSFVLSVQWHPETLAAHDPLSQRLFDTFVGACGEYRAHTRERTEVRRES